MARGFLLCLLLASIAPVYRSSVMLFEQDETPNVKVSQELNNEPYLSPKITPSLSPTSTRAELSQFEILSLLYLATNGDTTWATKTNWLSGDPCPVGSWHGIDCSITSSKVVTSVSLSFNGLVGYIPSQLGLLSKLSTIGMSNNEISGTLPSQLGSLTACTNQFHMVSNNITGTIPSEFGRFTGLRNGIYLNDNSLDGPLPSQLGLMIELSSDFYLQNNFFTSSFPSEIGQLTKLTGNFYIRSNKLSGLLPSQLGRLSHLTDGFEIATNHFTGVLPSQIGRLTDLRSEFSVNDNKFCGDIPSQVSALSEQVSTWIVATDNSFGTPCCTLLSSNYTCAPTLTPTISLQPTPSSSAAATTVALTEFQILSMLYIATAGEDWFQKSNWLTFGHPCPGGNWFGIICGSDALSYVTSISLPSNSLKGTLPSQLGLLTAMTNVEFSMNTLKGSLPSQIGLYSNLYDVLDLYDNQMTGSLPSELGSLNALLGSFYLNDNKFTGLFPSQIGLLTSLTGSFYVQDNTFSGSIPSELGQMISLESYFFVYNTHFAGTLPSQLGQLNNLFEYFSITGNSLSGSLPSQLGMLSILQEQFTLSSNRFCGDIPSEVAALSMLGISSFDVSTDNSLGTSCCEVTPSPYLCEPTPAPTVQTSILTTKAPTFQPSSLAPTETTSQQNDDLVSLTPTLFSTVPTPTFAPFVPSPTSSSQPSSISLPSSSTMVPTYFPSVQPTITPWFNTQLYFFLLIVCIGLGVIISIAMGYLFYRRLGRWPPVMRMALSSVAITSLGVEFIYAIAAGGYRQFCSYCPDNTGLIILSINVIICFPVVMYQISKLKLALDGNATFSNSLLYAPILLLAAFDGDLIVWLPWRDTVATQALSGFPDLTSIAFTAWSILCRKLPFLAFTIKLTADHTQNGDDSVIVSTVTLTITSISLLISVSQRLLRYLGYGTSNVDVVIGKASDFTGRSNTYSGVSSPSQLEGGLISPLLDSSDESNSVVRSDLDQSGRTQFVGSGRHRSSSPFIASSSSFTKTSIQLIFAVLIGVGVTLMVATNTTPPVDDAFDAMKLLLIAMAFLFALVLFYFIAKAIINSLLGATSHELVRTSTTKKMRDEIDSKNKFIEETGNALVEKDRDLEEQRKREEFIREYLRAQHGIEIEALLPLEEVKQNLAKAMRMFMGDNQAGVSADLSVEAEAEVMRWQSVLEAHPDLKTQMKVEKIAWRADELPRCLDALEQMRTIVPLNVSGSSVESLVEQGLPLSVARRITRTPAISLIVVHQDDIARMHPAMLRACTSNGLDLIELRAVFAALPEVMLNDGAGEKRAWLEGFQSALETLTKAEAAGTLRKQQIRHPSYGDLINGFGPFDAKTPLVKADLIKSSAFETTELRLSEMGNVSLIREALLESASASGGPLSLSKNSAISSRSTASSTVKNQQALMSLRSQKVDVDGGAKSSMQQVVSGASIAAAAAAVRGRTGNALASEDDA